MMDAPLLEAPRPFFKGEGDLLRKATLRFLKLRAREHVRKHLKDSEGSYAVLTDTFVIVSKKYAWTEDKIVSCHYDAAEVAANEKKTLVMYVEQEDIFYTFSPGTIMLNGTTNQRGLVKMLNFPVTLATDTYVGQLPAPGRRFMDG